MESDIQRDIQTVRYNISEMLQARGDDVSYIIEHGDAVPFERYMTELIWLSTDKTVVFFALSERSVEMLKTRVKEAATNLTTSCWWKSNAKPKKIAKGKEKKGKVVPLDEADEAPKRNFIVVIVAPLSTHTIDLFNKTDANIDGTFRTFHVKELMYNPLRHALVPPHRILTTSEAKTVMELYMISNPNQQMPLIQKTDVIARWLGVRVGDIVEITRNGETSGSCMYYRLCV
jgi:DNA-directed RNA polymerase subunit H (RpoH/RPB5)